MLDKKIGDITLNDIANLNIYDGVNFDKQIELIREGTSGAKNELLEILDRANQLMKKQFINQKINRIKENYNEVDLVHNLITTDYIIDDVGPLSIVASRTVEPGPESVKNKYNNWLFEGVITSGELQQLPALYPEFRAKYSEYNRDNWQLELDIVGGIIQGQMVISTDSIQDWRKEGVLMEPWGFNEDGKMTSFTDLMIKAHKEFKKKADSIRKKGRIDSIEDMRIIKLDDEGEDLFNSIFYQ